MPKSQKDSEMCVISGICPECKTQPLHVDRFNKSAKCYTCNDFKNFLRCPACDCDFEPEICLNCITSRPLQQKNILRPIPEDEKHYARYIIAMIAVGIIAILIFFINSSLLKDSSTIQELKQKYPSQKNETWSHILSVLEQKVPTVKSITLLYKNDSKTSYCLAEELVNIFSKNVKMRDVIFDLSGIHYRDYGEVLEHYHSVVKKFQVLVTNLSMVPSDIARMFHTLCDEVTSDIKPSLFIFTLQLDEEMEYLKPLEKATTMLKQFWSDLPDSDIFPLLSRIVKNVVNIVPEKHVKC